VVVVPPIYDPSAIRAILETDRNWAVYARGDLAPGYCDHAQWFHATSPAKGLLLLYRGFRPPVLFTLGEPAAVRNLLREIESERQLSLSVRPEILPLLQEHYHLSWARPMWRMVLDRDRFEPIPARADTARLGLADLAPVQELYADGEATGESPDAFDPTMLGEGVFFGIWEAGRLVGVAGTHLVAPTEGVAAIGNVYTRRDCRGRGLAGRATAAVVAELLRSPIQTVALNVIQQNRPAIAVYERLGFDIHCEFYEGMAESRHP
jgi:RimJ/RimL family protein N-acetyltransferase